MRKILIILLFLAANAIVKGQYIYKIKADSVLITNDSCNAELNLENHTRDTLGFLYNRGKGRTEFRRALIKINDSLYQIGSDTLNINSGGSLSKLIAGDGLFKSGDTLFLGSTVSGSGAHNFTNNRYQYLNGYYYSFGSSKNDPVTRPAFRIYDNGDFTSRAQNNLVGNQGSSSLFNGLRYTSKYGILEVGTHNNFDTTLAINCCGTNTKSAIIINSDVLNTFNGNLHNSVIGGDGMQVNSPNGAIVWSSVFGEGHIINGGVNKSGVVGYGQNISGQLQASLLAGLSNYVSFLDNSCVIGGVLNQDKDSTENSLVSGLFNQYSGSSQLIAGAGLIGKTPFGTTLGLNNVDFTSKSYKGWYGARYYGSLENYPLFVLGNSKYYTNSYTPSVRSNALTVLFNGRTQINTTGCTSSLTETDVTPKAAFEVVSNNSGVLLPKLTTAQRDAIVSGDKITSLLLFNTDLNVFQYWNGSYWKSIADSSSIGTGWNLTGNSGTNPTTNFLGTIDSTDLVLRTNNIERMRVASSGNVGIGTSTYLQTHKLAVAGKGLFADTLFAPKVFALPNNNLSGISTSWSKSLITTAYEGNSDDGITINGASNSGAFRPIIIGHRGRGTLASPTDVQNGDWLFGIVAAGTYNNSRQTPAAIEFIVDSIPNASVNIPTSINLVTGTNGGNRVTRLRVGSNGNVLIGTTTDQGFRLDVNGTARVQTIPFQAGRDTVLSYDPSTKQIIATKPSLPGTLIGVRILSSGTSYTPTTGTTAVFIELVGAGGGGGGVSGANNNVGAAGGGGGGSLLQKYITSVGSGSLTYAIGSGGTAGANTGGNGGNGGNTSITINSVTYTAPGGSGGVGQTAGTSLAVTAGGAGGTVATNGDVNGSGAPGGYATRLSGSVGVSGAGGSTPYGGGGLGLTALGNGNNGTGYGGGGGGGLSTSNQSKTGGTGASGVIIIYEYK